MSVPATHTKFSKYSGGRLRSYAVTASQSINEGDLLIIAGTTTPTVSQAIALPGSNSTGTASGGNLPTLGIATETFYADASGVSTDGQSRTTMVVRVIDDTFNWETRGYNATPASCQQNSFTVGTAYQFQRWRDTAATIWWYEIITTTTNGEMMCENRSPNSAPTDSYGVNIFKPILSATVRELA